MNVSENVTATLRAQEHGHQPIVFEPGAVSRLGGHCWNGEPSGALRADMGDNQLAVAIPINTQVSLRNHRDGDGTGLGVGEQGDPAYTLQGAHSHAVAVENRPQDSRCKISENGVVQTLDARMGMGGGNVPLVMNERQYALTVGEDVANTLTGTDYKGTQCLFEPKPTAFGICSQASNAMNSENPYSGVYEAETAKTLDIGGGRPDCNQGGIAVCVQGSVIGRADKNGPKGSGVNDDVSFTLTETDRHAVCYQDKVGSLCASDYKFPQQQQIEEGKAVVERVTMENHQHGGYRKSEMAGTLKANGGDYPGGENVVVEKTVASFYPQMKAESICYRENSEANTLVNGTNPGFHNGVVTSVQSQYVVRRLTPTECALLQGFPPDWCSGLETPEPTEEDIVFWTEVWETDRIIKGTSSKPKSRNQIIKWLKSPHSDAAEYKMWGNGVALPCVVFVLGGIVYYDRH